MSWRRRIYLVHRWIGLLVSLQLLAWSVGGLYFSLFDIDTVRGTADARRRTPAVLDATRIGLSPAEAIGRARSAAAPAAEIAAITEVVLRADPEGTPVYELRRDGETVTVVDAVDGAVRPPVDRARAERLARADFAHPATVVAVELLTERPPGELRGHRLPAWRVELDHPRRPRIYLDAVTGEVVARRNTIWRVFDFFWMLHIMDYSEREDFHHPLLTAMSALAVLTALSGLLLWGWRAAARGRPRLAS